jgi:hypothetical protein
MLRARRLPAIRRQSRAIFVLVSILGLSAPALDQVRAQGRWIDIGANESHTITLEADPRSRQVFPPYAFGPFPPRSYVYAELLPWPCALMPDKEPCRAGRFVTGYYSYVEFGSCPCTGLLLEPVALDLGYDPARVEELGAQEVDLQLVRWDLDAQAWMPLDQVRVHPEENRVTGTFLGHARQYYAIHVGQTAPVDPATWGRVKALWSTP